MVQAADEAARQAAEEEREAKFLKWDDDQRAKAERIALALKDLPPQVLEDVCGMCSPRGESYIREALGFPTPTWEF